MDLKLGIAELFFSITGIIINTEKSELIVINGHKNMGKSNQWSHFVELASRQIIVNNKYQAARYLGILIDSESIK